MQPPNIGQKMETSKGFLDDFSKQIITANGYESVIILATKRLENGDTQAEYSSSGNIYAVIGSMREYLVRDDERIKEDIRHETKD
jgi:hypothetical protein